MNRLLWTGIFAATVLLACSVIALASGRIPDVLISSLFIGAMQAGIVIPLNATPRSAKVLLFILALFWIVLELMPEFRLQSPNPICIGILALPALLISVQELQHLAKNYPPALPRLAFVILWSQIAYLLPYLLATPVQRRPPFAGVGCMSIACGDTISGASLPPTYVYSLGDHYAGSFAIVLVVVTAMLGRLVLQRALTQPEKAKRTA